MLCYLVIDRWCYFFCIRGGERQKEEEKEEEKGTITLIVHVCSYTFFKIKSCRDVDFVYRMEVDYFLSRKSIARKIRQVKPAL